MDGGYKHFSHVHNLIMHQIHETVKMSCSGCKSLVMGTIFVCWQCNFLRYKTNVFLKHPSHPSHPLTLVPYPTYPSNSFYCNSCKITGTGLSYSCSDCEFDLHVHCAHSVSAFGVGNTHQPSIVIPVNYDPFTNQTHGQEMVSQSGRNSYLADNVYVPTSVQHSYMDAQHSYMNAQHVGFVSAQTSTHNSISNPQLSSMAPNKQKEGVSIKNSDSEYTKMNLQRVEIAREEYRIAALGRKYSLDLI